MARISKEKFKKGGHIAAEITLVIAILCVVALATFGYRLKQGPLDIGFAAPFIKASLSDEARGVATEFDSVALHWPVFKGPVLLVFEDMHVKQDDKTLLNMNRAAVSLSYRALLIGQVKPKAIILDSPLLRIVRTKENSFEITRQTSPAEEDDRANIAVSDIIQSSLSMRNGERADDPLYGLSAIDINNAHIFVEDHVQRQTWQIPDANFRLLREPGVIDTDLAFQFSESDPVTRLNAVLKKGEGQNVVLDTSFTSLNPSTLAEIFGLKTVKHNALLVDGSLKSILDENLSLQRLELSANAQDGAISLQNIPFTLSAFSMDFLLDKPEKVFALKNLQAKAGELTLNASGEGRIESNKVYFPLKATIQDVPIDALDPVWPENPNSDTSAREWLVEKMSVGTLQSLEASLPFDIILPADVANPEFAVTRWDVEVDDPTLDFAFSDVTVDYRAPLMPAENVSATGTYKDGVIDIAVSKATIGGLAVDKGSVILRDLEVENGGEADIDIHATGNLSSALDYIDREPIDLKKGLSFDADKATGQIDLNVAVDFPTVKDLKTEQVQVKVDATLNDVSLPRAVKDLTLSGGPYTLKAANGKIELNGSGFISQTPLELTLEEYIEPKGAPFMQRVRAKLVADYDLREKFGVTLDDYIGGNLPLDIIYESQADRSAVINAKANLTPVAFRIDPLDYKKDVAQAGAATAKILLKGDDILEVQNLNIDLPNGNIKNGRLGFGQVAGVTDVTKGTFEAVTLPENSFTLDFVRNENQAFVFTVNGARLDARPFLDNDRKDREIQVTDAQTSEPPVVASGEVGYMRLSDEGGIENATFYADIERNGVVDRLEVDATVGNQPMALRYRTEPDTGKMRFQLDSLNAGAMLRALGLFETMQGGRLYIDADAIAGGHPNDMAGTIQIENFTVVDAPVLAKLINALSIEGLQELVQNQGMSFTRLVSQFTYQKTPEGTVVTFKDGATSGTEVGLTFEGKVNLTASMMDINGTIVPLSTINSFIGKIPLVGQILTGGDALFAATYKLEGPSKEAAVKINPLSVLAPGIIRKVLFEGYDPAEKFENNLSGVNKN